MVSGKIIFYSNDMKAFRIKGDDDKNYYGFGDFQVGDKVVFDYRTLDSDKEEILIVNNITKVKSIQYKKS